MSGRFHEVFFCFFESPPDPRATRRSGTGTGSGGGGPPPPSPSSQEAGEMLISKSKQIIKESHLHNEERGIKKILMADLKPLSLFVSLVCRSVLQGGGHEGGQRSDCR